MHCIPNIEGERISRFFEKVIQRMRMQGTRRWLVSQGVIQRMAFPKNPDQATLTPMVEREPRPG
jgi:hypothetical protein